MSKARLVITAVTVEKRPVSEVARAYGVARSWVYALLDPLQGRGRGSVRAAVPAAEDLPDRDQRRRGRPDHPAAQGTVRPGPRRRPADHRLAPAAASPGQRLGRDRQQVPDPGRAGHPEPRQAAEVVL